MPQATARRTAELLLQDHAKDGQFDVDFMDPTFTQLIIEAFEHYGAHVERVGRTTRLRVTPPSAQGQESSASKQE